MSLIAILAAGLIVLANFDWNRAKPWLNARVTDATGRAFAIHGDLSLTWFRPSAAGPGWRSWIPWPRLHAQNITLGNTDWARATTPDMAEIGQVDFSLNPLALLEKKIAIPVLQAEAPNLSLERSADGRNNWTFKQAATPSRWQVELDRLVLNKGSIHVIDAIKHANLDMDVDTPGDARDAIVWKMNGKFNGAPASGSGSAGSILSLQSQTAAYPIDAVLHIGKTTISFKGTLTRPRELAALDLRLRLAGVSMAQLYPLIGVVLPETPPFDMEGHLSGKLASSGDEWTYEKFHGKVGSSDLAGTLEYQAKPPRPVLTGEVVSNLLQFRDLAPLIGADSNASMANRDAAVVQPAGKTLPVEPFKTERWSRIDADVKFSGRKIIRDQALPIDDLTTHIRLHEGVLSLAPLDFGVAGGNLKSNIDLDGRGKAIKAQMKISARGLKLKQLFPTFQPMNTSLGEVNGDASLSATGNSVAAMLGSSNGEIKSAIGQGTISKLLLEEMGLNIGSIVVTKMFGDRQVNLNCMAADFAVNNGLMQTQSVVADTDDAVLHIDGRIDLARERMDLTLNARNKGLRLISLGGPIQVSGDFASPKVGVDKGAIVLRAGSAVALGVLAPPTALIPLTSPGKREDSNCTTLLAWVNTKPVAPPPGKTSGARQ